MLQNWEIIQALLNGIVLEFSNKKDNVLLDQFFCNYLYWMLIQSIEFACKKYVKFDIQPSFLNSLFMFWKLFFLS